MPRLTMSFVENQIALPEGGQVIIRDDILQGFGLRVTRGGKSYIAECRVNGSVRRVTIGKHGKWTPENARKEAKKLLGQMAAGVDPNKQRENRRGTSLTLAEAYEEYLESKEFRLNTRLSYNRVMAQSLGDWQRKPVTSITRSMVEERFKELGSGSKTGTSGKANANLSMQVLRAVLNYASLMYEVDGEPLIAVNPVSRLTQLRSWHKLPQRQGVVPEHKLADWYKAIMSLERQTAKDYYLLLILTGFRKNEALVLLHLTVDIALKENLNGHKMAGDIRKAILPLTSVKNLATAYSGPTKPDITCSSVFQKVLHLRRRHCLRKPCKKASLVYWGYDEMSRVTSEANLLGTFGYNYVDNTSGSSKGVTRLASINYPNNQVTNFDWYNEKGDERLKQIQNLGPTGNVLSQFNYRYNPAGEITQWPQIQNGLSRFQQLGYDLAGQLTTSQISNTTPSNKYLNQDYYAYDPGANRTGNQTNQAQNIVIGGTKTTGDVLTVTVKDSGLSGGQQVVNYTVQATDDLPKIAAGLAANITLDSNLQSLGVNAVSSSSTITVKSVSPNITTYSQSTSGGATETISIGTTQNFVENATIALKPGQSITVGDVLTLKVRDPALNNPSHPGYEDVSYTVAAGNTLSTIATGLKNAINANTYLAAQGITATSATSTVTIKSTSANVTVYRDITASTAKEYIDLNICPNGTERLALSGGITPGQHIFVAVIDAGLTAGSKNVSYNIPAGSTFTQIAAGVRDMINNDTDFQNIGVSATSTGAVVSISSNSPNVTTYRGNTGASGAPGTTATEILKLGLPPNGTQTAVIGGTKTTGNVLTITVYDALLGGGSKAINYTVQSGDTLATMTTGLANAINADGALQAIGVSATAVSTVLNITSTSVHATTYTSSLSGGATATITLARTIGAQLSAYNNVNELTSIAAGGPVRFQAATNKALKTASVNSNPAMLVTTKNFTRDESLASGASAASVAATDGANNTKTNTYQVSVNPVSTQNLTYDANGNMTSDGTNTYKWDAENRLIEIDYPGSGNKSEFAYDVFWRNTKIIETVAGSITETRQFVWCGDKRRECRDASGNVISNYLLNGQTISGNNYLYIADHLGSVRNLTDSSGTVQSSYAYDPFGRVTKLSGSMDADFQFTGHYIHSRSRLNLAPYRAYAPQLGRWLSRDPLMEEDGPNILAYVKNKVTNYSDPLGLIIVLEGCMNCMGYAVGSEGAVGPSQGQSMEGAMQQLGYSCSEVKSFTECDDKKCPPPSKKVMVYIYSYGYNPDNKDPWSDPWIYNDANDWHAVREDKAGSWSYFPRDWQPQDVFPKPKPVEGITDPDKVPPQSSQLRKFCCCKPCK